MERMKHLEDAKESYLQHLCFAWKVAFILFVHGLLPFVWETRASELMEKRK